MSKPNLSEIIQEEIKQQKIKDISSIMRLYLMHMKIVTGKERQFYYNKILEYGEMYKQLTGKPYYISRFKQ